MYSESLARAELRKLVGELIDGGLTLPGLVDLLRKQGREAEAERIESGPGFSLIDVASGVDIIIGGRHERLADRGA